jgi:hypothetical protein
LEDRWALIIETTVLAAVIVKSVVPVVAQPVAKRVLTEVASLINERRNLGKRPINDDLERAARKAYLQATLCLNTQCLKGFGLEVTTLKVRQRTVYWADIAKQLYGLQDYLRKQLTAFKDPHYVVESTARTPVRSDFMFRLEQTRVDHAVDQIRALLQADLQAEIAARHLQMPDKFYKLLKEGWIEERPGGSSIKVDWYDLISSFFLHEVKNNKNLEQVLAADLSSRLSGISLDINGLTSSVDQLLDVALPMLERMEDVLLDVSNQLGAILAGVEEANLGQQAVLPIVQSTHDKLAELISIQTAAADNDWTGQIVENLLAEPKASVRWPRARDHEVE